MKSYFSFVCKDNKVDIIKSVNVNRKLVEFNLRQNGFKVYKTLSGELYKEYQNKPPYEFFQKYLHTISDEKCGEFLTLMFGK